MTKSILTTERLQIREMEGDDVDHLLSIFGDNETMNYYPSCKDRHETINWIRWTQENYDKYGIGMWIVEDRGGIFLGQCGLVLQKMDGKIEVQIGFLFAKDHWGNGYATEAALACKAYGFDQMKFPSLISIVDPRNKPSVKVLKRIGMVRKKKVVKWDKIFDLYTCYR
ncbi:GNAT family N-acetyltransferase [Pseudalkalibacillus hwajinpoensis]